MPSVKEYKTKLNSLKNIEKITKTMKLVAASKLRQVLGTQAQAKLYVTELVQTIARLAASVEKASHPLLTPHKTIKSMHILLITSDKGLAGGFNNNLNRKLWQWIQANRSKYSAINVSSCGRRGMMFFRSRMAISKYYENVTAKPDFQVAARIGDELSYGFLNGNTDEVYLAYNRFNNPISQTPVIERILPISPDDLLKGGKAMTSDYIFEPDRDQLLQTLIAKYFQFLIYYALLENSAGEHGARMSAMDNASKNAADLKDRYTLLRNRARQASITKELIEIVSGAEALNKG